MAPGMTSGTTAAPDRREGLHPLRRAALAYGACLLAGASVLAACTVTPGSTKSRRAVPVEPGDDFFDDDVEEEPPPLVSATNDAGGAFGAESRPATKSADAGVDAGPGDAGNATDTLDAGTPTDPLCETPIGPADLVITELMIASRAGSNDTGEWVEVTSTRDCRLSLEGLTIASPRGTTGTNTVTIRDPLELPPHGHFVVAASADPAKNHDLPGLVVAWESADVLKNGGDTVTIRRGDVVVDEATYPSFSNLEPGRSIALPSDCVWSDRTSWTRWSLTFDAWSPGMKGTPNAANDDVACY